MFENLICIALLGFSLTFMSQTEVLMHHNLQQATQQIRTLRHQYEQQAQ